MGTWWCHAGWEWSCVHVIGSCQSCKSRFALMEMLLDTRIINRLPLEYTASPWWVTGINKAEVDKHFGKWEHFFPTADLKFCNFWNYWLTLQCFLLFLMLELWSNSSCQKWLSLLLKMFLLDAVYKQTLLIQNNNYSFCFLLGPKENKKKMKAPIPLLILLHAVVVHCLKVVSKRGSGKSRFIFPNLPYPPFSSSN